MSFVSFGFVHCNLGLNYSCMGHIVPLVVFDFVVLGSCCLIINFHGVIDLVRETNLQKCKNVTPSQQKQHGDETWQNAKQLVVEIVKNRKAHFVFAFSIVTLQKLSILCHTSASASAFDVIAAFGFRG